MRQDDDSEVAARRKQRFYQKAPAYLNMLRVFILSLAHDHELSEEIAQQTLVKYLSRMNTKNWQEEIEDEPAYLRKAAHNLLKSVWRARRKRTFVSVDQQVDDQLQKELSQHFDGFDVEKQIYLEELRQTIPLKTIFIGLNPSQMRLLEMKYVERLSNKEIARKVNQHIAVVRYELQKTEAKIRARVKAIFGDKKTLFKSDT